MLAKEWTRPKATDDLWTMLLVPNRENLAIEFGWSTKEYIRRMSVQVRRAFVTED